MQPKNVNKQYRGCYSFISVHSMFYYDIGNWLLSCTKIYSRLTLALLALRIMHVLQVLHDVEGWLDGIIINLHTAVR